MKQISIEIIQKCPNNCLHCSSVSGMGCTLKIDTEKVKEIIDSAKILDTQAISISGGEPFEHDGLMDIVEYAKRNNIAVYIYTSGIVSDIDGSAKSLNINFLKRLHNAAVDKLIFDLPAIDEEMYDTMMGTKGYQKFVLESIKKSKQTGIFTEIHFVPTKVNVSDIDHILTFAKDTGIDRVSFIRLVMHGRAIKNKDMLLLSDEDEKRLKVKLNDLLHDSRVRVGIPLQLDGEEHCYAGRGKLCIRYDGRVFGCETFKYIDLIDDEGKIVIPDSIYERRLDEIYSNSRYLKYEMDFVKRQMDKCGCNEKCPVQRMLLEKLS